MRTRANFKETSSLPRALARSLSESVCMYVLRVVHRCTRASYPAFSAGGVVQCTRVPRRATLISPLSRISYATACTPSSPHTHTHTHQSITRRKHTHINTSLPRKRRTFHRETSFQRGTHLLHTSYLLSPFAVRCTVPNATPSSTIKNNVMSQNAKVMPNSSPLHDATPTKPNLNNLSRGNPRLSQFV